MLSRFRRSATRSGRRGVVLLSLLPVVFGSFGIALGTHGTVRSVAGDVYCVAAVAVIVLVAQISFGGRNA